MGTNGRWSCLSGLSVAIKKFNRLECVIQSTLYCSQANQVIAFHETKECGMRAHEDTADETLQIQVPAVTKKHLALRAVETGEPIRVVVLRALAAYDIPVPKEAIHDRRKRRKL